jgi:L-ascorbate metabolism protein UlaG (beta-lactamase superfamily)
VGGDVGVTIMRLAARRAWVRIDAPGVVVHVDPAWAKSYQSPLPEMVGRADLVCISHSHKDHWQTHTLPRLMGAGTVLLAPARAARDIRRQTGLEARVVDVGAELEYAGVRVHVVHSYERQGQAGDKCVHPRGEGVGFVLTVAGVRIYHAGDCGLIAELDDLGPSGELGRIDVALLPIGGHGFTMDVDEAAAAARRIRPRLVVPMHELDTSLRRLAELLADEPEIEVCVAGLAWPISVGPAV